MKPHLPLHLLVAVLACLSWSANATESISINFGTAGTTLAGKTGTAGLIPVEASGWNNAVGGSNTMSNLVNQLGESTHATVQWTAPQSPWGPSGAPQNSLEETIQSSYLDLGANNQWTVKLSTDFLIADVYVLLSGDNQVYSPINVNGTAYAGDKETGTTHVATEADTNNGWGDRSTSASATIKEGTNALVVKGVNGSLVTLSNVPSGTNDRRGTLSGIQVADATDSYAWSRDIAGDTTWSASEWSNGEGDTLQSKTWDAILGDATLRAIASLNGSGTVTLDAAVSAEAVIARSGSSITLAGEQLNLTGLATLLAQNGAILTLDNTVTASGAVVISGSGKVITQVDQAWHGLSGSGTLEVAAGKTLALDGSATSDFAGRLILDEASTATLTAGDFSNKLAAEGSGVLNLAIDGKGATFGNSTLWVAKAGATAAHKATVDNATINGSFNILAGTASYGSIETTFTNTSISGTLSLGTGTLSATNGFVINVGADTTIGNVRLMGSGSEVTGDITLNVSGGVLGTGSAGSEGGMFSFVGQDSSLVGNVNFNISGGSIVATYLSFGGFGQKNNHSLLGNVNMTLTNGSVESNIYAGSSWGGRIEGNMTVVLSGGSVGAAGQTRELSAGCTGANSWASQSVSGDVLYVLDGGTDGYGTSFLGTYSILGGGDHGTVGGSSTVTLRNVTLRDETDDSHGVANFTGVVSGANANGTGVTGTKALVFDNYQTLAQANFKYFDTASVQGNSHVTLTNASNTGIAAWAVKDTSELTVRSAGALGGGSVALDAGAKFIYDSGTSTEADTLGTSVTGSGSLIKKGSNTLTANQSISSNSLAVEAGGLAVGNTVTTARLAVAAGANLILQTGAEISVAEWSNSGTIVVAGAAGFAADSAAMGGNVEWTGGSLTLGSASQYAASTTTLTSNASHMILTLSGDATAETTVSFALGNLVLDGGLLTFSMTGGDTSLFSADHFTLTTTGISGAASVRDSVFLSLNNVVYEGVTGEDGTTITFITMGDLQGNGADAATGNYKLNASLALSAATTVSNLFLIPTDGDNGLTLTMDAANGLTVNGTLTIEGAVGPVNLAGGNVSVNDMKLTSGSLVLQAGATLTVNRDIVSTGGNIRFDGGTFAYGTDYVGDISSLIATGGTIKVATAGNDVTWATGVNAPIVKEGEGRLSVMMDSLNTGGSFTVNGGELAVAINNNLTTSITAENKLTLEGTGTFVKTGAGTWQISQENNASKENSNQMSSSSFAGDLLIEEGTLLLGKTVTGGIGENLTVSADALGTTGTVRVANGAIFKLGITQNGTVDFSKNVSLEGGATLHTIDGNYNFKGHVSLAGDATIRTDWGKTLAIRNLIEGSGKLTLKHDGGAAHEHGYLLLDAQNAADFTGTVFTGGIEVASDYIDVRFTHTQALGSGAIKLNNSNNKLDYQGSGDAYEQMANVVSGNGGLKVSGGHLEVTAENTYAGATEVAAGSLKVSGSLGSASSENTYAVAQGATLAVSGSGSIANSAVVVTARPSVARDAAQGTLTDVTVTKTEINRTSNSGKGLIDGSKLSVTVDDYVIKNVQLVDTLIEMQTAGKLTLNNVTVGAGTVVDPKSGSIDLVDSTLVMQSGNTTVGELNATNGRLTVTSTGLEAYTTISGSLTLELTKDWIDALVKDASGHFTSIDLTFTDVNADAWKAFKESAGSSLSTTGALNNDMFGVGIDFGDAVGQVIISTTPPTNIPEPASAALALLGLGGLLMRRHRKQN